VRLRVQFGFQAVPFRQIALVTTRRGRSLMRAETGPLVQIHREAVGPFVGRARELEQRIGRRESLRLHPP
jgi:hypothetical protein